MPKVSWSVLYLKEDKKMAILYLVKAVFYMLLSEGVTCEFLSPFYRERHSKFLSKSIYLSSIFVYN